MAEGARSYGGQSAQERVEARRGRLIEAAIAVLSEGESSATMTRICARAGLTERYFYESFASRDEALVAALDAVAAEIAAVAVAAIESTSGMPADRVHAALSAVIALLASEPEKGRVAVIESTSSVALRARRQVLLATFADLVSTEAASLYGDQAWPPDRAKVNGLVLAAGIAELVGAWLSRTVALEQDELVSVASELFIAVARQP